MREDSYYDFSHRQDPWVLDDGRFITSDGEELFTAYVLETVGRIVLVREFTPRSSSATPVMRLLRRHDVVDDHLTYASRRPAKARSALLQYHLHNDLSTAVTLTMSGWEEGAIPPLRRFIERLRYTIGGAFPWTAVAEIGERGNPHWHVCLPGAFLIEELHDQWGAFNISTFELLMTHADVTRWTSYMGKTFDLSFSERLTYRRFHSGPGFKPRATKVERITRHEAKRLAQTLCHEKGSELAEWTGTDAWCPAGFFWPV